MEDAPYKSTTLMNSPIEFVLIGPLRGRDRVLLRSDGAGLDLIGFGTSGHRSDELQSPTGVFSIVFDRTKRWLNIVESGAVHDIDRVTDDRKSHLRFVWVGACSESRRKTIEHELSRCGLDLSKAIREGDLTGIEMSVAPLVLHASLAHLRGRARIHRMWTIVTIYVLLFAFMVVGVGIKELFRWLRAN